MHAYLCEGFEKIYLKSKKDQEILSIKLICLKGMGSHFFSYKICILLQISTENLPGFKKIKTLCLTSESPQFHEGEKLGNK